MQEFDPRHFTFHRTGGIPRGELHAEGHYRRLQRLRLVAIGIAGVSAFAALLTAVMWAG